MVPPKDTDALPSSSPPKRARTPERPWFFPSSSVAWTFLERQCAITPDLEMFQSIGRRRFPFRNGAVFFVSSLPPPCVARDREDVVVARLICREPDAGDRRLLPWLSIDRCPAGCPLLSPCLKVTLGILVIFRRGRLSFMCL